MSPHERLSHAIAEAQGTALVPFMTAGYPDAERFIESLDRICGVADAVEIGVPFSDPMADGVTIQRSSHAAIAQGVSLKWLLDQLTRHRPGSGTPLLLMSYLNPLLAYGYEALAADAVAAGVTGFIIPDLPYEERTPVAEPLSAAGLALVQLVTPLTPRDRLQTLCSTSTGFVYAVTRTGVTGAGTGNGLPEALASYLETVRSASPVPVCAGFGIRDHEQVAQIGPHADGVIVGSALIEVLERGDDPVVFLQTLKGNTTS